MSRVERYIRKRISRIFRSGNQSGDEVAKVAFVLRGRFELFAGEFDYVGGGVVARAGEFEEGVALGLC